MREISRKGHGLAKKAMSSALALSLVTCFSPVAAFADVVLDPGPDATPSKSGSISPLAGDGSTPVDKVSNESGAVTFEKGYAFSYVADDAVDRGASGFWAGARVTAPDAAPDALITITMPGSSKGDTFNLCDKAEKKGIADGTDKDGKTFVDIWSHFTYAKIQSAGEASLVTTIDCDWDGDGATDQTFTLAVDPEVTLDGAPLGDIYALMDDGTLAASTAGVAVEGYTAKFGIGEGFTFPFFDKDASLQRPVDGYWAGVKIVSPLAKDDDASVIQTRRAGGKWSDAIAMSAAQDGEEDGKYYTCIWNYLDYDMVQAAIAAEEDIAFEIRCDWEKDGVYDQLFTVVIDPANVTLAKPASEAKHNCTDSAVLDEAVAPTISTEGKTAGFHCSVCGKVIIPQNAIAKLGGDIDALDGNGNLNPKGTSVDKDVAAFAKGYVFDFVGKDDNDVARPADGYWAGVRVTAPASANEEKATITITMPGSTEGVKYELSKVNDAAEGATPYVDVWSHLTYAMIQVAGKDAVKTTIACDWDGDGAIDQTFAVAVDPEVTLGEPAEEACAHKASETLFEETKAPTCAETGEKYAKCDICGQKTGDAIEIEADAHKWGDSAWSWADDKSVVTVARHCPDCGKLESAAGSIAKEIADGKMTYTAKAKIGDDELTDTKVVKLGDLENVPALSEQVEMLTAAMPDLADDWYLQAGDKKGAFEDGTLYLAYAASNGLMQGYTDKETGKITGFGPNDNVSRAQVATILYRYANPDSTDTTVEKDYAEKNETELSDVKGGEYYTAAVNWCVENEIVMGDSETKLFYPDRAVTRQELVTMIGRLCIGYKGMESQGKDVSNFKDGKAIADYALEGAAFCYAKGIVSGMGDTGEFAPADNATRAQMAKIIAVTARNVIEASE